MMSGKDNMRKVLSALIEDPTITNITIANRLGLSSTGIGKIRDRLETNGIIKGYNAQIQYEMLGLNAFGILHVKVTSKGWNYKGHKGIQEIITSNPNIVGAYRVPGRDITHILLCVFRNLIELDRFIHVTQSQLSDYIKIVDRYIFSSEGIIKESYTDLFLKIVNELDEERMAEPILFGKIMGEEE